MSRKIDIKQFKQSDINKADKIILKNFISLDGTTTKDAEYAVFNIQGFVKSLGYICPIPYNDYPIYLTINGEENQIFVGVTGIYEINHTEDVIFNITEVALPTNVDFIFNYETLITE